MAKNKITTERYVGLLKATSQKKSNIKVSKIIAFVVLTLFCIIWMFPLIILFLGSLRGHTDAILYPKELFYPHSGYTIENYVYVLTGNYPDGVVHNSTATYKLGNWFLNSTFSALGGTFLYLLVASLAAYAFTFIDFKYSKLLFAILVATMVVPGTATSIGNQMNIFKTGLNKSLLALILPGLGGVYGMYLIKTFFEGIPKDLIESAKMDGYSNLHIFFKIVLPLGKTVLFVQGLFGFMNGWNDLVWPQMLYGVKDNSMWTLQVGIAYIINNSRTGDLIGMALAAGVISLLPVFIMYIIAANKIIEGMSSAGIKR